MFLSILAGIDGSEAAAAAIDEAIELAVVSRRDC